MHAIESLESHLPSLEEHGVGTIGHEVAYHPVYEYLAGESVACDPRRVVHGGAEEPVGFVERVAGVDSYPDADRWRTFCERAAHLTLDRLGA